MSTKIIAIVLVAVIAVAGIGAVALMGGGDEPSTPIPGGEDAAVGYDAILDASKFGAEIGSVKGPEGLKVTIEGTGDSQKVVIEGIPKGETSIEVTYVDGKVSVFILKASVWSERSTTAPAWTTRSTPGRRTSPPRAPTGRTGPGTCTLPASRMR